MVMYHARYARKRVWWVLVFGVLAQISYSQVPCPVKSVIFTPSDSTFCDFPATVIFEAEIEVDTTPIFQKTESASQDFQKSFSHTFLTAANTCLFALKVSGTFAVWSNPPELMDAQFRFHPTTNDSLRDNKPEGLTIPQPLYVWPKGYNPAHEYWFFYPGDGRMVNVDFVDRGQYNDNIGSMNFEWYAVPCFDTLWNVAGLASNGAMKVIHTFDSPGNFPVQLTVTERQTGCTLQTTGSVEVFQPMTIRVSTTASCPGAADGQANVQVNGGEAPFQYQWSAGQTSDPAISGLSAGQYSLTITDNNGCQSETGFEILEKETLVIELEENAVRCFGQTNGSVEILDPRQRWEYSLDGQTFQQTPFFENLPACAFQLQVRDEDGCLSFHDFQIDEPPLLSVSLPVTLSVIQGGVFQLQPNISGGLGNYTFQWTPSAGLDCSDCATPLVSTTEDTEYMLTVTDKNGCTSFATVFVKVEKVKTKELFVPTAFSPNNDGLNDFFTVYADASVKQIKTFRIFDRWGATIFESDALPPNVEQMGWDGTVKGKILPIGLYVWFAEVEWVDGMVSLIEGEVNLVR